MRLRDTFPRYSPVIKPKQDPVKNRISTYTGNIPDIQRQPACPCDGGCPLCVCDERIDPRARAALSRSLRSQVARDRDDACAVHREVAEGKIEKIIGDDSPEIAAIAAEDKLEDPKKLIPQKNIAVMVYDDPRSKVLLFRASKAWPPNFDRALLTAYRTSKLPPEMKRPLAKKGLDGCPVPELQSRLNAVPGLNANLKVDGRFGTLTENAVYRFQRLQGLTTDGQVGPDTWSRLLLLVPDPNLGLPTGETTMSEGWKSEDEPLMFQETFHDFIQELQPNIINFTGCVVTERPVEGSQNDECYEMARKHDCYRPPGPYTLTGGTWVVDDKNRWGKDIIGLSRNHIAGYQDCLTKNNHKRCAFSVKQSMQLRLSGVVSTGRTVQYKLNLIRIEVEPSRYTVQRDNVRVTKKEKFKRW